jgi:hypothetical protein
MGVIEDCRPADNAILLTNAPIGSPSGGKYTTEGVSRTPSESASRMGNPASTIPMSELVVPRSMPTISLMSLFSMVDAFKQSDVDAG